MRTFTDHDLKKYSSKPSIQFPQGPKRPKRKDIPMDRMKALAGQDVKKEQTGGGGATQAPDEGAIEERVARLRSGSRTGSQKVQDAFSPSGSASLGIAIADMARKGQRPAPKDIEANAIYDKIRHLQKMRKRFGR